MALGPGKYDDLCTKVREEAKAEGAIVVVIHGEKGSGFSIQATMEQTVDLPRQLRAIADNIEESIRLNKMFA